MNLLRGIVEIMNTTCVLAVGISPKLLVRTRLTVHRQFARDCSGHPSGKNLDTLLRKISAKLRYVKTGQSQREGSRDATRLRWSEKLSGKL